MGTERIIYKFVEFRRRLIRLVSAETQLYERFLLNNFKLKIPLTLTIENEKVVAIAYKLNISDNNNPKRLAETVDEKNPMYFMQGNSGLPEKFEENLQGKKVGDVFNFSIRPTDGFGEFDESEVMNLPIGDFYDEAGMLDPSVFKVGRMLPMSDEEGHQINGIILEINPAKGYIKMDFNHPLAGKDLHFEGKVLLVRDATAEEKAHGHVHGEGGHHH